MDALDRRLLKALQADCRLSAAALAERCGTSESTALRRRKKLRRDGVIRAERAVIDSERIGRGLQLLLNVRLEREDQAAVKNFIAQVAAHPDVLDFYFVTGTVDYVIRLSVARMEDYDLFLRELIVPEPLVIATDTNVVIRAIKQDGPVPID